MIATYLCFQNEVWQKDHIAQNKNERNRISEQTLRPWTEKDEWFCPMRIEKKNTSEIAIRQKQGIDMFDKIVRVPKYLHETMHIFEKLLIVMLCQIAE